MNKFESISAIGQIKEVARRAHLGRALALAIIAATTGINSSDAVAHPGGVGCEHVHGPEGYMTYRHIAINTEAIRIRGRNVNECIRSIRGNFIREFNIRPILHYNNNAISYFLRRWGVYLPNVNVHCISDYKGYKQTLRNKRKKSKRGNSSKKVNRPRSRRVSKIHRREARPVNRRGTASPKVHMGVFRDCLGRKYYLPSEISQLCRK